MSETSGWVLVALMVACVFGGITTCTAVVSAEKEATTRIVCAGDLTSDVARAMACAHVLGRPNP